MPKLEDVKIINKNEFNEFVNAIIKEGKYDVVGVKEKRERFVFDQLNTANELRLDYDVTILPPKKYFLPQIEKLMDYDLSKSFYDKKSDANVPRIIIVIHPYDIIAIDTDECR